MNDSSENRDSTDRGIQRQTRRHHPLRWLIWVLAAACLAAPQAKAGFIGYYDLANFSLINTNTDGTALAIGGLSLTLTGGNNGSGLPGSVELVIVAPLEGMVRFDY